MPTDIAQEKRQIHELVERLGPGQVAAARTLLQAILDPAARAMSNGQVDDEPVTDEDRHRFHAGRAWLAQRGGKGIPMEQILAEFGLNPDDFPSGSENAK